MRTKNVPKKILGHPVQHESLSYRENSGREGASPPSPYCIFRFFSNFGCTKVFCPSALYPFFHRRTLKNCTVHHLNILFGFCALAPPWRGGFCPQKIPGSAPPPAHCRIRGHAPHTTVNYHCVCVCSCVCRYITLSHLGEPGVAFARFFCWWLPAKPASEQTVGCGQRVWSACDGQQACEGASTQTNFLRRKTGIISQSDGPE